MDNLISGYTSNLAALFFYLMISKHFHIRVKINGIHLLQWTSFIIQKKLSEYSNCHINEPSTTVSQDVQTRFSVQLAFAKFLSKIKGNF